MLLPISTAMILGILPLGAQCERLQSARLPHGAFLYVAIIKEKAEQCIRAGEGGGVLQGGDTLKGADGRCRACLETVMSHGLLIVLFTVL